MDTAEESSNSVSVTYVTYDDLCDCFDGGKVTSEGVIVILSELSDSKADWRQQFAFLDTLRQAAKHGGTAFLNLPDVQKFYPIVKDLSNSIRSNLSKNALVLIGEIFKAKDLQTPAPATPTELRDQLLNELVPVTYQQIINDKSFIKNEAKNAVKAFEERYSTSLSSKGLSLLCDLLNSKNVLIGEAAFASLARILKDHLKARFNQLPKETQSVIVKSVSKVLHENKRAVLTKNAETIAEAIKLAVGTENFEHFLQKSTTPEDAQVIVLHMKSKIRTKTPPSGGLHEFISSKKKMMLDPTDLVTNDTSISKVVGSE